ncbi:DUF7547 family protein [Haloglomus halophilum]|uniref:DUF7547 family protein n=1 Tax=Haloglomus halophilum TaxID=2962672 RepID=UPI0020C99683|nr:hypothetical protein [Haloglomus halophilum]
MSDWKAGGEPIPVQVSPPGDERGDRAADSRHDRRPVRTRDDDLGALVDELEATLRQLRAEVDEESRPPSRRRPGSGGPVLPRPPSPRELLTFTERYTIPTVVAFLEAAIRGLELLAGTIRLLDGRDPRSPDRRNRDGGSVLADVSTAAGERAAASGREALSRVDDALAELQRTYEGDPEDPTARRLLADARELRGEIDERLAAMEPTDDAARDDHEAERDRGPTVNVDAELASLKEQAGRDDEEADQGDDPTADDPDDS